MNTIKDIAKNFVNGSIDLDEVKTFINNMDLSGTYRQVLKKLGLSYFVGLNSSSKIEKGLKKEYNTLVLYLAASKNAGIDVCPFASDPCRLACLVGSGRAGMERPDGKIHIARLIKTWIVLLRKDIAYFLISEEIKKAGNLKNLAVRLNGTSDLNFKAIYNAFPNVQFYDYTKDPNRKELKNYQLTFSYSGENIETCIDKLKNKKSNVAIAILKSDFEAALNKYPSFVYNGDDTDLRFLDNCLGKICLLKVKGNNVKKSKFIMNLSELDLLVELVKKGK